MFTITQGLLHCKLNGRLAMNRSLITLTTDFGTRDGFVGQMKGVILAINPHGVLIDITHDIEPYSILHGALVLKGISRYFPLGTIHVAVVDPGVGTNRRAVALRAGGQVYIGPDNGLFTLVMGSEVRWQMRRIENCDYVLPDPHPTFHGRDVFAPAAAHLSLGKNFDSLGAHVMDPVLLSIPGLRHSERCIEGEVVSVDRFGNLMTNVEESHLTGKIGGVTVGNAEISGLSRYFAEVPAGEPLALINSFGYLEIAVNRGNASAQLEVGKGASVEVRWR
jgi:S-adenosyl-L-methionine hydrolase (adenosine-forming)